VTFTFEILENKRFTCVNKIFPIVLNMVLNLVHGNNCKKENLRNEYIFFPTRI
jgi:hypothetical protein